MDNLITYIYENKEWIFSGVGVLIITILIQITFRPKEKLVIHKFEKDGINEAQKKEKQTKEFPSLDNRVTFTSGETAFVEVNGTMQTFDPRKILESEDTFEILRAATDMELRQYLESISIKEAREKRKEIGKNIVNKLQDTFNEHGVNLKELHIGSIQEIK